jgi:hypothetical protein
MFHSLLFWQRMCPSAGILSIDCFLKQKWDVQPSTELRQLRYLLFWPPTYLYFSPEYLLNFVRFEVLTAVKLSMLVFWDVQTVCTYRNIPTFRRNIVFHLQGWRSSLGWEEIYPQRLSSLQDWTEFFLRNLQLLSRLNISRPFVEPAIHCHVHKIPPTILSQMNPVHSPTLVY